MIKKVFFIIYLLCASLSYAEQEIALPTPIIDSTYSSFKYLTEQQNFAKAGEILFQLIKERDANGYRSLEEFSLNLLSSVNYQDYNLAKFKIDAAILLSPDSELTISSAIQYFYQVENYREIPGLIFKLLVLKLSTIDSFIVTINELIIPFLISLTAAYLLIAGLCLLVRSDLLLTKIMSNLGKRSELLAGMIILILLSVPLVVGPIVTVFIWTAVIFVFLPAQYRLGFYGITVILAWLLLVPLHKQINVWKVDSSLITISKMRNFSYTPNAAKKFLAKSFDDPVFNFHQAQLLKNYGMYSEAERVFKQLKSISELELYAEAEIAGIKLLRGQYEAASSSYAQLREQGLDSAEFFINYSKAAFKTQELDLSTELYKEALRTDSGIAAKVKAIEEAGSDVGVLNLKLPGYLLLSHFKNTFLKDVDYNSFIKKFFIFGSWIYLLVFFIILIFLYSKCFYERKLRRAGTLYKNFYDKSLAVKLLKQTPYGMCVVKDLPHITFKYFFIFFLLHYPILRLLLGSPGFFKDFSIFIFLYLIFILIFFSLWGSYINKVVKRKNR